MSSRNRGFAYGGGASGTAISGSFAVTAVAQDATNSPSSSDLPNAAVLTYLDVSLSSMSGSPTSITFKLTRDAGGDHVIINSNLTAATQTIEAGETTATDGGVTFGINTDYVFDRASDVSQVAGTLYVWLKTNTGTANAKVRLGWRN
tara:strand:- start:452 stop:892 length:441 start_codon:yes stop_codon:yes gene_type:complete